MAVPSLREEGAGYGWLCALPEDEAQAEDAHALCEGDVWVGGPVPSLQEKGAGHGWPCALPEGK